MPSLRKDSRGRSPFWICCYTSATGQRLQKSTKIAIKPFKGEKRKDGSLKTAADKKTEALEFCLSIDRAENHGAVTEQAAKKIIGEILERTTGEPLHSYKTRDWLAHWLDMKEQVRASKTATRYRQVIRDFVASLGDRANLALAHLTPKDVLTYRNSIIKANKMTRTATFRLTRQRKHLVHGNLGSDCCIAQARLANRLLHPAGAQLSNVAEDPDDALFSCAYFRSFATLHSPNGFSGDVTPLANLVC